ncbi:short-chain dehydrogenase [PVC group bacterium (ex Bugula neritina AB1)]|nr:short-chain dehydrogenase [PVC group bacterium (ex Bugula neritina AB1)]
MSVVLILGAKSDIAQACALTFLKKNYSLILAARKVERLKEWQKDMASQYDGTIDLVEFDACDFESHRETYRSLPKKPDIALICFGYLGYYSDCTEDFSESKRIIEVNFTGAVSICNIIAHDFKQRDKVTTIIGVSSVAGDRGRKGNYIYGSTKAAFQTYLSGLRQHLFPHNVHVIDVRPGFIQTPMTAHVKAPRLLTSTSDVVAKDIWKAFERKKDVLYTPWFWKYIMLIVKSIPGFVFKRIQLNYLKKK